MPQHKKTYPIERSPLYRLGKKSCLSCILQFSTSDIKMLRSDENYDEWEKIEKTKNRTIEQAKPRLRKIHKRLHVLLQRIETPPYLKSGIKGSTIQSNAEIHASNHYMLKLDIQNFYQSSKREFVFTMFRDNFQQTPDVASILADLVTYKGHIPTGTSTSQIIAFWAYKKSFDKIYQLAQNASITMTLWVDDITFSSKNPIPKDFIEKVSSILNSVNLQLKTEKTESFGKENYKIVTGCALSPCGDLKIPNKKRKEIINITKGKSIESLPLDVLRTLIGKISAQRQTESDFFKKIYERALKQKKYLECRT